MLSRLAKRCGCSSYEDVEGENRGEGGVRDTGQKDDSGIPSTYNSENPNDVGKGFPDSSGNPSFDDSIECWKTGVTYSVEQAIDQFGFGKFQIKLSLLTGLAWMSDAMEMMILAILPPALHCMWQLTDLEESTITIVVFFGMMFSSGFWGSMGDKYGRRVELILCSLVTFYFGVLSAFSPSLLWLLVLRGLVGVGIGGAPQAITLYAEFLPTESRATCVTLVEMFWAVGAAFQAMLALLVMPTLGWQYLLGFSSLPLLIFAICCLWLPESARYDLTRGHYYKAVKTLSRIADENGQPMPVGRLLAPKLKSVKQGKLRDLLNADVRKTTILLWIIWFVCSFSYYGVVLLTTALFEDPDGCHGTDVDWTPGRTCFVECKTLSRQDYQDLTWITFAEFPGLVLTAFLLETIGRKNTMALEFSIFSVFVLLVNICSKRALLTVFLFVARAFISGAFQAAYVYTPEFYPTSMRAMGLGVCSGVARVGSIITPFIAQVLLRESAYLAITSYGLLCLTAAVSSLLLPLETKGEKLTDRVSANRKALRNKPHQSIPSQEGGSQSLPQSSSTISMCQKCPKVPDTEMEVHEQMSETSM